MGRSYIKVLVTSFSWKIQDLIILLLPSDMETIAQTEQWPYLLRGPSLLWFALLPTTPICLIV